MANGGVRHDCGVDGCFNESHRLNFSVFDDCWQKQDWRTGWQPSPIRPTDIDFCLEQRGRFLLMEWKDSPSVFNLSSGQGIAFRKLSSLEGVVVILVQGQAKTMMVERVAVLSGGYDSGPKACDLDGLKRLLRSWSRWADRNPAPTPRHEDAAPPWFEK